MTELITLVCFALLISPALVYYVIRRKHRLAQDRVLERRLGDSSATPDTQPAWIPPKDEMPLVLARLRLVPWVGSYLSQTMQQATVPLVLAIPALLVAGTVISGHWLKVPGALICGLAAATLPVLYARRKGSQRLALLSEQLPYLIDLLKSALESGHTMLRALQMAGQNLPEPISSELRLIVEQVQLGMTLPLAFEAMYQRAPVEELAFLVAAVRVQTDVGNSMAEIFQHVAEGMRNRQRAEHQLRALTAQSRAGAIIVTLLPFIVLLAFSFINPSYSRPLFHNAYGQKMLETAVVLDIIAFLVMRKIARVDY
ncbi:MAG TPA: type II secretion system F family protein [Candidatus Binataceae bacterium]|jgi:tight adherence protein B|nr:type II secretion system F family protein [Candidatus Binataceae bacterium]